MFGIDIVDWFGIAGFVLSLFNLIYFFFVRRERLLIEMKAFWFPKEDYFAVSFVLANKSQLPISVIYIDYLTDGTAFSSLYGIPEVEGFKNEPTNIYKLKEKVVIDDLPIEISPLGSQRITLVYNLPVGTTVNPKLGLSYRISTSRHNRKTIRLFRNRAVEIRRLSVRKIKYSNYYRNNEPNKTE